MFSPITTLILASNPLCTIPSFIGKWLGRLVQPIKNGFSSAIDKVSNLTSSFFQRKETNKPSSIPEAPPLFTDEPATQTKPLTDKKWVNHSSTVKPVPTAIPDEDYSSYFEDEIPEEAIPDLIPIKPPSIPSAQESSLFDMDFPLYDPSLFEDEKPQAPTPPKKEEGMKLENGQPPRLSRRARKRAAAEARRKANEAMQAKLLMDALSRIAAESPPSSPPNSHSFFNPFSYQPSRVPGSRGEFLTQDVPNDGNCQLHAIKKALEMNYPKHKHLNKSVHQLRAMGANLVAEKLPNLDPKHDLTTYLTQDMDECNEGPLNGIRKKYNDQLGELSRLFKIHEKSFIDNKIDQAEFQKRTAPILARKQELIQEQDAALAKGGISTFEHYIEATRKDGFWCGQMHLYALSEILEVPIHVHEEASSYRPKGQMQIFNPTNAQGTPLQILRVNGCHYHFILAKLS